MLKENNGIDQDFVQENVPLFGGQKIMIGVNAPELIKKD